MPQCGFYSRAWYSNTAGLGAYRGPWGMESLARETLLDVAAREKLGIDPIELRRRNLTTKADQPCTTPLGIPLEDITPAKCLEKLLEAFDVAAFPQRTGGGSAIGPIPGPRYGGLHRATAGAAGSIAAADRRARAPSHRADG